MCIFTTCLLYYMYIVSYDMCSFLYVCFILYVYRYYMCSFLYAHSYYMMCLTICVFHTGCVSLLHVFFTICE